MSKRGEAAAKAQYERDYSALEGNWEEASPFMQKDFIASAEVGLAAADAVMFSDKVKLRLAKTLLVHTISDGAGNTAPEIMEQCESAVEAIIDVLKKIANE